MTLTAFSPGETQNRHNRYKTLSTIAATMPLNDATQARKAPYRRFLTSDMGWGNKPRYSPFYGLL